MHVRQSYWTFNPALDLGISLPLAFALMQDVTMRTTARMVIPGWDAGYGDLYQYGFPLAFTHWGAFTSEADVFLLLPMLLDLLLYFFLTWTLMGFLKPLLNRKPLWRWVLAVVAWSWMALTLSPVVRAAAEGNVKLVARLEVLTVQDPAFSWRKGGLWARNGPP